MIKVSEEHAEQITEMSTRIDRCSRMVNRLEAQLDIAKGRRMMAAIKFWDYAEIVAPEIKNYSQNCVKWSAEHSAFTTGDEMQGV